MFIYYKNTCLKHLYISELLFIITQNLLKIREINTNNLIALIINDLKTVFRTDNNK